MAAEVRERYVHSADDGARLLGIHRTFTIDDFVVHDDVLGPGCGVPTDAPLEANRLLAHAQAPIITRSTRREWRQP